MRSATLTAVLSFCRPSRGPTSTMRTWSLMLISSGSRLDLGEFDAFLHDIADLAFDLFQQACERRAQGLLHLHHFKGENWRALFERGALLGQQGHNGAGQGCHDLVFADLLLVVAAKWIDPVQFEATVARPHIEFVAFDHRHHARYDSVEG